MIRNNNFFDLKKELEIKNILFFIKRRNEKKKQKYRLITEYLEFEQIGSLIKNIRDRLEQMPNPTLISNASNLNWKCWIEVNNEMTIKSNNIKSYPDTIKFNKNYEIGEFNTENLCLKIIFKITLRNR